MALSFTNKLIEKEGGDIRFILTTENDKPCWCYLKVEPSKFADYKRALKHKTMDIREYGEILYGGWGDYPPEDVVLFMEYIYGYETLHDAGTRA